MTNSTRPWLQKTRLRLVGGALLAALGCVEGHVRPAEPASVGAREAPRARAPAGWGQYVVQPGDTLGGIATCRGTSVAALAAANHISVPDRLPAGAILRVPGGEGCARPQLVVGAPPGPGAPGDGAGAALHRVVTDLLARATADYDGADFEEALSLAQIGLATLAPHPGGAETDALRARCHMVSGMAAAGLGERERAIAEFRRALAFAPELPLDAERSSPRVLELVEAARAASAADEAPYEPFVDSSTR